MLVDAVRVYDDHVRIHLLGHVPCGAKGVWGVRFGSETAVKRRRTTDGLLGSAAWGPDVARHLAGVRPP